MIQCIAVDDEPLALSLLEDNIKKVPYLHLAAKCGDAFAAMKALQEQKIDLMFIDIQMPGLTGLQFIQSLQEKPMIILITAYKQFALDSYDLDVVDYLVKPVALDRFMKACNKANALYELKTLKKEGTGNTNVDYFFIHVEYSMVKVLFNDIVWIEALKDYIKIHLKSTNRPIMSRSSLTALEKELPSSKFIRIHKSYIISIDAITAIRKSSVFIKDFELPIGETYRDVVGLLTGKTN